MLKIELDFTEEQLEKIKRIAKMKNIDVKEYIKTLIKTKIDKKS